MPSGLYNFWRLFILSLATRKSPVRNNHPAVHILKVRPLYVLGLVPRSTTANSPKFGACTEAVAKTKRVLTGHHVGSIGIRRQQYYILTNITINIVLYDKFDERTNFRRGYTVIGTRTRGMVIVLVTDSFSIRTKHHRFMYDA